MRDIPATDSIETNPPVKRLESSKKGNSFEPPHLKNKNMFTSRSVKAISDKPSKQTQSKYKKYIVRTRL